jgi:hypothetical protein
MAAETAILEGITLPKTEHPRLPFMGVEIVSSGFPALSKMEETGCTVPPHLRPLCTMHTCDINSCGFKPSDPRWTKEYFKLRVIIERLEAKVNRF